MRRWLHFIWLLLAASALAKVPERKSFSPEQWGLLQLIEANGTARLNEDFGYAYDAAHNLAYRTNHTLVQTFTSGPGNELNRIIREGTLTAAGSLTGAVSAVAVNGKEAALYSDGTFATKTGLTLRDGNNLFVGVGTNAGGALVASAVTSARLPAAVDMTYDGNGNLIGDGQRSYAYNDANELTVNGSVLDIRTHLINPRLVGRASSQAAIHQQNGSSGASPHLGSIYEMSSSIFQFLRRA